MQRLVVVLLTTWIALGCGEAPATPQEIRECARSTTESFRARIEERDTLLREIAADAMTVPRENVPPIDLGGRPKLARAHSVDQPFAFEDPKNPVWAAIALELLRGEKTEASAPKPLEPMGLSYWFTKPHSVLAGEHEFLMDRTSTEQVSRFLTELFEDYLGTRYLLVVRTHDLKEPVMLKAEAKPKDWFGRKIVGSFVAGQFVGDVLLYDIPSREMLGGFAVEAESSSQVSTARSRTDPEYLRTDLTRNLAYRIEQGLKAHAANR